MKAVRWFLCAMVGYHILHTILWFGRGGVESEIISVVKDVLWIVLVGVLFFTMRASERKLFWNEWKWPIVMFGGLILWSLGISLREGISVGSIAVGSKYDLYPLFVLLSALMVGVNLSIELGWRLVHRKTAWIILGIVVLWIVRQGAKVVFPELFTRLWYGPIGDYALGSAPPLRYRTGPWGMMRLQWIFAWPNNYWFFLVALTWVVSYLVVHHPKRRKYRLLGALFWFSLWATISRWALVGAWVAWALTVRYFFPRYKKQIVILGVLCVFLVLRISMHKTGSTAGHRTALIEWLQAFVQQPRGYGLGMAGPSVHYEGVYLPENQFMQIILDVWLPGLLLRCGVRWKVLQKTRLNVRGDWEKHWLIITLLFGIVWLMVEWLFLHVREDSMVNYLILWVFGILVGRLSLNHK